MKYLRIMLMVLVLASTVLSAQQVQAQCAVCTTNVETNIKNGGTVGKGLNHGIMYLLGAPYLAIAALAYIWYKKYRRKNVNLNMRSEKLHMN